MAINLLPWRELQIRKKAYQYFFILIFTGLLIMITSFILRYYFNLINSKYKIENYRMEKMIAGRQFAAEDKNLIKKQKSLYDRTQLIQTIHSNNHYFWQALSALKKALPHNVQITYLIWSDFELYFSGITLNSEQIPDLVQALEKSLLFSQVIMEGIKKDAASSEIHFSAKAIFKLG